MRTMVAKGRRGIDCSFAVPPPERLIGLGFDFVIRYLSVPPSSPAKNWTRAQIEVYREAGIDVGAVWEMSAARANLGATYGEIDGRNARLEARKLDWPDDIELLTACDLNSFVDNIDRHEMYVRGFHKTNGHEWIGLYGDTDILARTVGVWNIGWVPIGAWAWSGTSRADAIARAKAVGAHVLQSKGYYIDNVWAVDPNDVINPFPLWASKTAQPAPTPTPPLEDDMATAFFEVDGLPGQYMWTPGSDPIPFTNPADRDVVLKGLGVDPANGGKISQEMYQRMFVPKASGVDADALAAKVAELIVIPPLTGHLAADLGAGGHITGSVG